MYVWRTLVLKVKEYAIMRCSGRMKEVSTANRNHSRNGEVLKILGRYLGTKEENSCPTLDARNRIRTKKEKTHKIVDITEDDLASVLNKRKNWSAPGISGVQNYW